MIRPAVPTPWIVLFDATLVMLLSEIVPLTRTIVGLLDWTAEMNWEALVTVTVDPPAPPVVPAPNPIGPAAAAEGGLVLGAAEPLPAATPVSATTAEVTATALASLNRALVLRMRDLRPWGVSGDVRLASPVPRGWHRHDARAAAVDDGGPRVDYCARCQ
ncbi:hypothetical protein GCM10027168_06090 [Streptomyces capparidis]